MRVVAGGRSAMTGAEIVEYVQWARGRARTDARQRLSGADEAGICEVCRRPFLFNGHVVMPRTCGRERCMREVAEAPDLRVLQEPTAAPAPAVPPRTRRPKAVAPPEPLVEPICRCICHLNYYRQEYGLESDAASWVEACEHCAQPA